MSDDAATPPAAPPSPPKRKERATAGIFKADQSVKLEADGYPVAVEGKKPRGNPPKLNADIRKTFIEKLSTGAPVAFCAESAGVSRSVIYDWLGRGQQDEKLGRNTEYRALYRDVARARADWWVASYGKVSLGEKGWKARAWLMERHDPARLAAPPRRLEHSGPGGGAVRIVPTIVELPEEIPDPVVPKASPTNGASPSNGSSRLALPDEEDPEERISQGSAREGSNGRR